MFCLHSQPSTHWLVRKCKKRNCGLCFCPFFCAFSVQVFQGGNRNKKRRDSQFIGWWCCWWNTLAFFLQLTGSGPPGEPWPLRHGRASRSLGTGSARRLRLEPHWALSASSPGALPPGLCHQGIGHALCKQSGRNGGHICCLALRTCFIISSDFTYTTQVQRWIRFSRKRAGRSHAHKADFSCNRACPPNLISYPLCP